MKTLAKSIITELKKNTDINNHSENLVLLAEQLGNYKLLSATQSILNLHNYFEYLTHDLSVVRNAIIADLRVATFAKFDNAQEIWNSL